MASAELLDQPVHHVGCAVVVETEGVQTHGIDVVITNCRMLGQQWKCLDRFHRTVVGH